MSEKIIEKDSLEQYTEDMQRYSIYVTRKRVTPSLQDGLKPVHRRILYCMFNDMHALSYNSKVKSASIVGRCLERYHPHGDASVYGAFKPMANWFEIKEPLVKGEGNFGNFQGDVAAASRYTEAYLTPFALEAVIGELQSNRQVTDWTMSYNDTLEPEYLPVKVPLLLINGSFSIGVGLKVDIPTHNLAEVIDETIKLIHNPNAPVLLVPDHCMPCTIFKTDFRAIGNKGYGSYKVRGIIDIGTFEGKTALFIRSTPNLTYLDTITEKIEDLVATNKIVQIQNVYDKSTVEQMNFVIILKKGSNPEYVREVIYKNTEMEQNCRVNFEVLDDINPIRMSYKSYLLNFIEFRKLTKYRMYCNELQKVQTNIHEREAFIKALESGEIDNIINMIKKQTNTDDTYLVEYLIKKLHITDLQAKYILGSDLRKLAIGYLPKYKADLLESTKLQDSLMYKIIHEDELLKEIVEELTYFKKKYGKPRVCKVVDSIEASEVPKGEFKVIVTENNFIKKIPISDGIGYMKNDAVKRVIKVENTENVIIFDEMGKVFKLPVNKIPFTDKGSNGIDIRILIKGLTANINTIMYEPIIKGLNNKVYKSFILVITANGYMKRMDLADFVLVPPSGIIYTKLEQGDSVKDIIIVGGKSDIIVYSDRKAIRLPVECVSYLKRNTRGTKALNTDTSIDGLSVVRNDTTDVVVVTEQGKVNRFSVSGMPVNAKTKTGMSVIKLGKTDRIKSIFVLNVNDGIRVITNSNRYEIPVNTMPEGSSIGGGAKLIPLHNGEAIIRCDVIKGEK